LGTTRKRPEAVAAAHSMSRAMTAALADPKSRTGDIRGTGNTASMTAAIIEGIRRG
jgi:3-isopropylmalate dehydrogenase